MHRCGDVDVLQVLQGLGVVEPQRGARAEGDPDAHPGHHHVGHHHPLVLVGLQLSLVVNSRAERHIQSADVKTARCLMPWEPNSPLLQTHLNRYLST